MAWQLFTAGFAGILGLLFVMWCLRRMGIWSTVAQPATPAGNGTGTDTTGTGTNGGATGTGTGTGTTGGTTPPTPPTGTGTSTATGGTTNVVITDPTTTTGTPTQATAEMQLIGLIRDGQARGLKADIVWDPATGYRRTSVEIDPWDKVTANVDQLAKEGDVELTSASGAKMSVRQRPISQAELEAAGNNVIQQLLAAQRPAGT